MNRDLLNASPDEQLDRTLEALGEAHPSPDFNQRLLTRLEAREGATARRPRFGFFAMQPRFAVASAGLVLALGVLLYVRTHSHSAAHVADSHAAVVQPAPGANAMAGAPSSAPAVAAAAESALGQPDAPPQVFHLSLTNAPVHLAGEEETPLPTAQALDAQALADLHAPSQPAPPLPSTDQERLVALMLRHGEKHDLAELSPEREAAFARQEQRAFHEYFDPPVDPRLLHQDEPALHPEPTSTPTQQPQAERSPQ